jgi:hypothetical protein
MQRLYGSGLLIQICPSFLSKHYFFQALVGDLLPDANCASKHYACDFLIAASVGAPLAPFLSHLLATFFLHSNIIP